TRPAASAAPKIPMSVWPSSRLVTAPAVIDPLTLIAVRPMSISGSTEISRPARATGRLSVDSTISAANVAPPPTPAMPNDPSVATITSDTRNAGDVGSTPALGAIITASMAGYSPAHPFWPIVAPKLAAKFAIAGDTPSLLICVSMLSGIVAALDRDVNAKVSTGQIFW